MTTPATRVETEVATDALVVEFVHGLGGDVLVTAYNVEGDQVSYLMAVDISRDEVEVHMIPESGAVRLIAELTPPEG